MAYQSLYRKYRPQTFADVVGQSHVTRTLQNALASGRVAHGYLFTGTRGTAKTTVARLLAKALNCESADHPVAEPCNQCAACRSITSGSSIDVIEMDAASHRGVADIEDVRKSVGYGPMELRYKVFIIDEAHQLSSDAKDAFLKTLEEPPANVVFILATTEPQAIPITIRSRCQQFDFKRGSLAEISGRLQNVLAWEGVGFTPDAVNLVARGAEGSYRDALSLLEQVLAFSPTKITAADVNAVLGTLDAESLGSVVEAVASRDAPTAFSLAGQMLDSGKEARTLLKTLAAHFRDLLLVQVGGPAVAMELTPDEVGRLQAEARLFTPEQMMKAIDLLNTAQGETRWNNQHRLLVELTFLKLMNLGDGPAAPMQTAPIVFAPAAEQPVKPVERPAPPPPVAVAAPSAKPAPVKASIPVVNLPEPPPPSPAEESLEELPAGFFASDGLVDTEDDFEPDTGPGLFESDGRIEGGEGDLPDDSEDDGFGDDNGFGGGPGEKVPTPDTPSGGAARLLVADEAAEIEKPAPVADPAVIPEEPETPELPNPGQLELFNIDDVFRALAHFLGGMQKVSKATQVVMGRAQPTGVDHGIIEIILPSRFHFEQMNDPKRQEIVRKLLARCLGVERVSVRFVLSAEAQKTIPAPRIEKKKEVRDPLAALEALDRETNDDFSPAIPRPTAPPLSLPPGDRPRPATTPPVFAVSSARPQPVATSNEYRADRGPMGAIPRHPEPEPERSDGAVSEKVQAAMEHPLVQEVLSIFGGEIVVE